MEIDYEGLREKYRPLKIEVLLIAEAPPSGNPPRFFYHDKYVQPDSLYKEMMSVIFHNLIAGYKRERIGSITLNLKTYKQSYLKSFQDAGFWLQDAVRYPLEGRDPHEAIKIDFSILETIIKNNNIKKCILIKNEVYKLKESLEKLGVRVLNKGPLPFPGSSQQASFRKQFGEPLIRNGYMLPSKLAKRSVYKA